MSQGNGFELVFEDVELSAEGEFSGVRSSEVDFDLTGLIPKGEYHLVGQAMKLSKPEGLRRALEFGAFVQLLKTEDGGRKSATPPADWRPMIKVGGKFIEVRLYLGMDIRLEPGQGGWVRLHLVSATSAELFGLGSEFEIWESRKIGSGLVQVVI